jgi:hypothetical protein
MNVCQEDPKENFSDQFSQQSERGGSLDKKTLDRFKELKRSMSQ